MKIKILFNLALFILVFTLSGCGGGGNSSGNSTAAVNSYTISGKLTDTSGVGILGVTVMASGSSTASTMTDANGNYSFTGLSAGSYILFPSLSGYRFSPATLSVTVNGANVSGMNSNGDNSTISVGSGSLPVNSIAIGPDGTLYAGINAALNNYSSASINTFNTYTSVSIYKTSASSTGIRWNLFGKVKNASSPYFAKLIVDPNSTPSSTTIYAGFDNVVFKGYSGNKWKKIGTVGIIEDMAIQPTSSIIYLATLSSVFQSYYINNSLSWYPINNGLPYGATIYTIAIDPSNPNNFYAGGHNGVLGTGVYQGTKKIDPLGQSYVEWAFISSQLNFTQNGNTYYRDISSIVVDPNNSSIVYAGAFNYGLFKSTNSGANWVQITEPSGYVSKLVMDNNNKDRIYLLSINGLYFSLDGGTTWKTSLTTAVLTRNILDLVIDPKNSNNLYAMYSGGVLYGNFNPTSNTISWTNITQ